MDTLLSHPGHSLLCHLGLISSLYVGIMARACLDPPLLCAVTSPYLLSWARACYDGMVAQDRLNWEPGRQLLLS